MTQPDDVRLAYAAFAVFADDGRLDMDELNGLLTLALADGAISEGEKRILRNVFDRLDAHTLDDPVRRKIDRIRTLHGV
jgi:uncharacterized tellurite resistance protein B-like protein